MSSHHHHQAVGSNGQMLAQPDPLPLQAPEINASESISALILLAGMLAVLAGRQTRHNLNPKVAND